MGASDLFSYSALATHEVLSSRDWLKMIWVDAGTVAAKMVEVKTRGDGAYDQLIQRAMRWSGSAAIPALSDFSVSVYVQARGEDEASIVPNLNFLREPIQERSPRRHH